MSRSADTATAERIARRFVEMRLGLESGAISPPPEIGPMALQEALDWMSAIRECGLEIVQAEDGR